MNSLVSRRDISTLASRGFYEEALQAHTLRQHQLDALQLARRRELLALHDLEQKSFQEAKTRCVTNARVSAAVSELRATEALHHHYNDTIASHAEEMDAFRTFVTRKELQRAIAASPLVAEVRRAERQLADAKHYAAAARANDTLRLLEHSDRDAAEATRRAAMRRRWREKEKHLHTRAAAMEESMRTQELLNAQRADEEVRVVAARLRFLNAEMNATHRSQQRAINLPFLEPRAFSKAQRQRASRGTQLKKRIGGDHFYVPSLCNMYSDVFDNE